MSDNKQYYYMRLKDNFFDTNEMKVLEAMPDGYKYSNILLKLYLMSLKENGKLMLNERIPYNPQMIATITRHSVGDVEKALRLFRDLGLIDILDSGAIYMLDIQKYIGKSSTEADRQREYQRKITCSKNACKISNKKSTPEIEIELEKDIEIDKEKDIDIEIDKKEKDKKKKRKTDVFQKPSEEEIIEYCNSIGHGEFNAERFIDYYESNGWMVGKNRMKDWKATVRNWIRKSDTEQMPIREKKEELWF